jgi:uncharacterized protein (TIGR00251 family)
MRLKPIKAGFLLPVKVVPGASRARIAGAYGDGIKVTVTAPPEAGAANEAVIALLAEALEVPTANVRITRGHASPRKEVLIVGLTADEIEQRLLGKA